MPDGVNTKRVTLTIHGKVQGVFFRESSRVEATRLGLAGSVRNLQDGGVEVIAEGEADAVEALALWCHRGPPAAQVTGVERHDEPASGDPGRAGFVVLR
jgi:acylphosphatase